MSINEIKLYSKNGCLETKGQFGQITWTKFKKSNIYRQLNVLSNNSTKYNETGKKAIFVNKFFTTRIVGLEPQESKFILDFLFSHIEKTEFQIRYRWNKNDMAFWDNRCTIHKALWDYFPHERKGRRVTIKGDIPF